MLPGEDVEDFFPSILVSSSSKITSEAVWLEQTSVLTPSFFFFFRSRRMAMNGVTPAPPAKK